MTVVRHEAGVLEVRDLKGGAADALLTLIAARIELPHPADDVSLGEIEGIFLDGGDRQQVIMPVI